MNTRISVSVLSRNALLGSLLLLLCCCAKPQAGAQTIKDRINRLATQPGNYGASLQLRVMIRANRIAERNRPYVFNGVQDCWGYVRQVWNAILYDGNIHAEDFAPNTYDVRRWINSPGIAGGVLVADAPNSDWVYINDRHTLLPGDLLSTAQGHAWGENWHGGIFAGKDNQGVFHDFDNTPYTSRGGGDGAYYRTFYPGFHWYYKPIHDLLARNTAAFIENRMYQMVNHPEVYVYVKGGFYWVRSVEDVVAWGGWNNIIATPDGSLHINATGSLSVNWTMVRERSHAEVYLVWDDGSGYPINHIMTEARVMQYGGWGAVQIVPNGSLDFYRRGPDLW